MRSSTFRGILTSGYAVIQKPKPFLTCQVSSTVYLILNFLFNADEELSNTKTLILYKRHDLDCSTYDCVQQLWRCDPCKEASRLSWALPWFSFCGLRSQTCSTLYGRSRTDRVLINGPAPRRYTILYPITETVSAVLCQTQLTILASRQLDRQEHLPPNRPSTDRKKVVLCL